MVCCRQMVCAMHACIAFPVKSEMSPPIEQMFPDVVIKHWRGKRMLPVNLLRENRQYLCHECWAGPLAEQRRGLPRTQTQALYSTGNPSG